MRATIKHLNSDCTFVLVQHWLSLKFSTLLKNYFTVTKFTVYSTFFLNSHLDEPQADSLSPGTDYSFRGSLIIPKETL